MPEVRPFRGLRYNTDFVRQIDRVLAPPYDVISDEERKQLASRSPYNIVHLTLPPLRGDAGGERDYLLAAATLEQWRREGVLVLDPRPAIYVYEVTYQTPPPRSEVVRRRGLIAAVRLEALGEGGILPHEGTLDEPKRDRLLLTKHTECAFSQVFAIYDDPAKRIEGTIRPKLGDPDWAYEDEHGHRHRFWTVVDPEVNKMVAAVFRETPIVIADGHHRYETALAFRDYMRQRYGAGPAAWDYVTMFLCNIAHRSLTILPAHRMIRFLPREQADKFEKQTAEFFDRLYVRVERGREGREKAVRELLELMSARSGTGHVFGAYWGRSYAVAIRLRDKERALRLFGQGVNDVQQDLDVALLHAIVIRGMLGQVEDIARTSGRGNIYFERDPVKCLEDVDAGRASMALLCNPTRVEDVMRVALARQRMPQKGTYFWPKLPAGIVLYDMRPGVPTIESPHATRSGE
ncbi:MAG: DUF1015 domain-containing protein [Armatimonadetes bacterium]|nr:DUF1015 domain-containing protein [Armatimonadota bacterium]